MGDQQVLNEGDEKNYAEFMHELLADVSAMEIMLRTGIIESDCVRIGAEQEMVLIDQNQRPAPLAASVLAIINDPRFTIELARFNMEANLTPLEFSGDCLRKLETELNEVLRLAGASASQYGAGVLLTGILPGLSDADLTLDNMTDSPRYRQLNSMLSRLRRSDFFVHIKGIDEIHLVHNSMMLEACNTSFQVHLQVSPEQFVDLYNLAQLVTAPVLAVAVNSPLLFGKRLWAETRLALFQHSVDERSNIDHERHRSPRVMFGDRWVNESLLEIFREDVARFRVLLTRTSEEDPLEELSNGRIPRLGALRTHNGTVWRWNRPCYGILNGVPHIRIENRALPAGPTVLDETANAAFFYGLMASLNEEYGPIHRIMDFDLAKANFFSAARNGLDAQLYWLNGKSYPASVLIMNYLLPMAKAGLRKKNIDSQDIGRYLGVIEERIKSGQTGAEWIRKSFTFTDGSGTLDMRLRALTAEMLELQNSGKPVHEWPVSALKAPEDYRSNYETVGQFMSTALFTVRPDDIVDYVASIMHWERIRHIPVEDEMGNLAGLVSQRDLMVLLAQGSQLNRAMAVPVREVMKSEVITITPETKTLEAIELMRRHRVGCLPVLKCGKLVGIVTTFDIAGVSSRLLEAALKANRQKSSAKT